MSKGKKSSLQKQWPFYVMIIPGFLYLLINNYGPMLGMFIAFKKVDYGLGIFKSPWVGLENFEYLFKTDAAAIMTRNTILYNVAFIVLGTILGVAVGIMLSELRSKAQTKFFPDSYPASLSALLGNLCIYRLCVSE